MSSKNSKRKHPLASGAIAPQGHIIDDRGNVRPVCGTLALTRDGAVIGVGYRAGDRGAMFQVSDPNEGPLHVHEVIPRLAEWVRPERAYASPKEAERARDYEASKLTP